MNVGVRACFARFTAAVGFTAAIALPRLWYCLPESDEEDDNPRTNDPYGHGDLRLAYAWRGMTFSARQRNNLRADGNMGAVQIDWSSPFNKRFKSYVQYLHSHGESLIDYDVKTNRIGVGFMLTDRH